MSKIILAIAAVAFAVIAIKFVNELGDYVDDICPHLHEEEENDL